MTNASSLREVAADRAMDLWSLAPPGPAPRDAQRLLIAVASGSGTCVDGSFEDAEAFLLFEKSACNTCFIGRQPCSRVTGGSDMNTRTRLLCDCDLVLCAGISETCMNTLSRLGIGFRQADAGSAVSDAVAAL